MLYYRCLIELNRLLRDGYILVAIKAFPGYCQRNEALIVEFLHSVEEFFSSHTMLSVYMVPNFVPDHSCPYMVVMWHVDCYGAYQLTSQH